MGFTGTTITNLVDSTITDSAIADSTIATSIISGTATVNQSSSSANSALELHEASTVKAYLQFRGTAAGTLPNTVRLQTQTGSSADIIVGTNAGSHIFVAGGQNGLTTGFVGIAKTTPACALDVYGEIRASAAGSDSTSVATVGGTQTLTAKTLTSPKITSGNAPASAGAAGTAGQIEWDSSYLYVCVATNSWKRVAIAAW